MPLLNKIELPKGLLCLWEITESIDELWQMCSNSEIEEKYYSITNIRRKKEWLATRLILKEVGCDTIKIRYNKSNQPYIEHPKYNKISISHSGKLAGIIFHEQCELGLDIENIHRNFKKIAHKYLSAEELELSEKTTNGYGLAWCTKEAIYKAAGIPGVLFKEQISINNIENNCIRAQFISNSTIKKYQLRYFQYQDYLIVYLIDE